MTDTVLSDTTIELLERIDESVRELESPSLNRVDASTHTVSDDCICGCCGDEYAYSDTYITTYFEFEKTPPRQQDRVCWECLGRYLDEGDWDRVASDRDGTRSVGGLLRLSRNHLRSANSQHAIDNGDEIYERGVLLDHLGVLDLVEEIEEKMVEVGELEPGHLEDRER